MNDEAQIDNHPIQAENVGPSHERIKEELAWVKILSAKNKWENTIFEGSDGAPPTVYVSTLVSEGRIEEARKFAKHLGSEMRWDEHIPIDDRKAWNQVHGFAVLSRLERKIGMEAEADAHLVPALKVVRQTENSADNIHGETNAIQEVMKALCEQGKTEEVVHLIESRNSEMRNLYFSRISLFLIEQKRVEEGLTFFRHIGNGYLSESSHLALYLTEAFIKNGQKDNALAVVNDYDEYWKRKKELNHVVYDAQYSMAKMYFALGDTNKLRAKIKTLEEMMTAARSQKRTFANEIGLDWLKLSTGVGDKVSISQNPNYEHKVTSPIDENLSNQLIDSSILLGDFKEVEESIRDSRCFSWIAETIKRQESGADVSGVLSVIGKMADSGELARLYDNVNGDNFNGYFSVCDWLIQNNRVESAAKMLMLNESRSEYHIFRYSAYENVVKVWTKYRKGKPIDLELLRPVIVGDGQVDLKLIAELGSVVSGSDREKLLSMLPDQIRDKAKTAIHLKLINTPFLLSAEEKAVIFGSAKGKIETALSDPQDSTRENVKLASQIMYGLNHKEAKDFIFGLIREKSETVNLAGISSENGTFLRLIKTMADMNTIRGNEFLFDIFKDERLGRHESIYLLNKLVANNYMNDNVVEWLKTQNDAEGISVIKLLSRSGVNPSKDILAWLSKDRSQDEELVYHVNRRLDAMKTYQVEFDSTDKLDDLRGSLVGNKDKAMAYYILHNGQTRFDLINNYSFEKFYEILVRIGELPIHEAPLDEFQSSLERAGFQESQRKTILENLRSGRHPFFSDSGQNMEMTIRLDVSNSTKYEAAGREVGAVFGRDQIGVCLKTTFYRKFLTEKTDPDAAGLLERLNGTADVTGRKEALSDIEKMYPDVLSQTTEQLRSGWTELGRKMDFGGISVENLLSVSDNPVDAESVIGNIESRREELKSAKRELILALRQVNPRVKSLQQEIKKMKRKKRDMEEGINKNPQLQGKIDDVDRSITNLENEIASIGLSPLAERFANLSSEERDRMMQEQSQELTALDDKNPSQVLMYQIMQLSGEESLTENDVSVIREVASHLEGPMGIIRSLAKLDERGRRQQDVHQVKVRMMDKKRDLMTMVRFADSKICCFSSSNYEMQVAHNTPNKEWVASINRDPLSFVFEIEDEGSSGVKNNLGFVFGMYGVSEDGQPEVFLNGVYFSGGNDVQSANNIIGSIEDMLSGPIRAQHQFVASMYGGQIDGALIDYSSESVHAKRLRAIDNGSGKPVVKIYDDLGKQINEWVDYQASKDQHVWHKTLRDDVEKLALEEPESPELDKREQPQSNRLRDRLRNALPRFLRRN